MHERMYIRHCRHCAQPGVAFRLGDITGPVTRIACVMCGEPTSVVRVGGAVLCSLGPDGIDCTLDRVDG